MKRVKLVPLETTVTVAVRLTKEEVEVLQAIAALEERNVGAHARYVLRQYIRNHRGAVDAQRPAQS